MLIYASAEDAIIKRLQEASDSGRLGYRLPEVCSYGGQLDEEALWASIRRFPAVWVTCGGHNPKPLSARKMQCTLQLAVMAASRNVRGERQARVGAVGEVGTYQMLQDVVDLLSGSRLGLAITPLRAGRSRTLYNTRMGNEARSVLAMEFAAEFTYTNPDPGAAESTIETINLQHYLKPGDDVADSSDVVTVGAG